MADTAQDFIDLLDDALVSEILQKFSAEEIHELLFVCKKWFRVISQSHFMKTNLRRQQQSDNMIVQIYDEEYDLYRTSIFSVRNTVLGNEKVIDYLDEWKIQASCNGLLLVQHCYPLGLLAITNPLTKYILFLPPCPLMDISSFALVFIEATQTYYAIHMYDTNHPGDSTRQNIECHAIVLGYDLSEEQVQGLQWTMLWDGNFLGHTILCSANPICLNGGILVWKLNSGNVFLAWDVGSGSVSEYSLPGKLSDEIADNDDRREYFLVNKGGSLVFVDYNETWTVVRGRTFDWDTQVWGGLWGMGLHAYDDIVGYEVDAIQPHFISKNNIIIILNIDGRVFQFNSDIVIRFEHAELSHKDILFCGNHVESIVWLEEAPTFPLIE